MIAIGIAMVAPHSVVVGDGHATTNFKQAAAPQAYAEQHTYLLCVLSFVLGCVCFCRRNRQQQLEQKCFVGPCELLLYASSAPLKEQPIQVMDTNPSYEIGARRKRSIEQVAV